MKSLKDLEAIRNRMQDQVHVRKDQEGARIVVGMATCGIAAGARPVLAKCVEEVNTRKLNAVSVTQTGCIGVCRLEPIMEIYMPGEEKVTYVKVTADMVPRIIAEHVVNGRVVDEYTIGRAEANQ